MPGGGLAATGRRRGERDLLGRSAEESAELMRVCSHRTAVLRLLEPTSAVADGAARAGRDAELVIQVGRVGVRFGGIRTVEFERLVDQRPAFQFVPVDQSDGDTCLSWRPVRPMR